MHHGRRYPPPVDMKPRRERERERECAWMQLFNAEIPWIPCIPSVQGRGRVTGSSAADSSASKEASGRAGKPAGHPFGRRLYSSRAIRRLGCSVVRGSLRREMRTTVAGGRRRPTAEREGMHRGSFPYNTRNAFKYGMPTHRLFQICR